MIKDSTITISLTNNYPNFKLRLPSKWLNIMEITRDNKEINISYKNNSLVIKKADTDKSFKYLSIDEKILQIKKYTFLYEYKFPKKRDLFNQIGEYFNISPRTAYRYLKDNEEIKLDTINNISLIQKQEKNSRNINIMYVNINSSTVPMITIPTNLALFFFKGKSHEELGIKSVSELFNENFSYPIVMKLDKKEILIELNQNNLNHFL